MRYLLDTHVLLWILSDSGSLGSESRNMLEAANAIYVSSASVWEIRIKVALGKLIIPDDFLTAIIHLGFGELALAWDHVNEIGKIELPHKDPFDRALLAQAWKEQLTLVTADDILLKAQPILCLDARK